MATNIIYKGELNGTQVDFSTGSLTDISTFDTDVRSSAIQNQIVSGVTDRGASQDALISMSGYLAANAHPDVTPASNVSIDNSNGTVLQDATFTFDADGHVTAASFVSANLDNRYYTETEIDTRFGNTGAIIGQNAADIDTLSGLITSNDGELAQLFAESDTLSGLIDQSEADIDTLSGLIDQSEADIDTLSGLIDALEANSGANTLQEVTDANNTTTNDITVSDIRVAGGNITGPSTITIDPDASGAAGTVVIQGDLQVKGTTTTINSSTIELGDLNLTLGTGAANAAALDGGGIQLSGTTGLTAEFVYDGTNDRWSAGGLDIEADLVGNADTASAWATARTITLAGDLGGSVSINGSSDVTLTATVASGSIENAMLAGSIELSKLVASTFNVGAGSGLAGGGSANLGGTSTLNIGGGNGITVNANDITIDLDGSTLALGANGLKVNTNGISSNELATNAVFAAQIADDQVTADKLAHTAVTAGSYTAADITVDAQGRITAAANGTISSAELETNAVTTIKIANDAVTSDKLDSSVAGDNITFTNGVLSVGDSDIVAAITGGASSIATTNLTAGRVLISDGSGKVTASATISSSELNALDNISSNIQNQLDGKALKTTTMTASNGLTGGGDLSANRTFATVSDQGHLDEIELGSDDTSISNVVTKGGVLILRGTDNNGITTSGADGNAIDLNDKTTVSFEGVVQSADTAQDSDNGSYVAMWKIQGVIRRDADSTNMLQSFVTKTFAGSNASSYGLDVAVNSSGLKISSDQTTATLVTSATITYNWLEDAS